MRALPVGAGGALAFCAVLSPPPLWLADCPSEWANRSFMLDIGAIVSRVVQRIPLSTRGKRFCSTGLRREAEVRSEAETGQRRGHSLTQ